MLINIIYKLCTDKNVRFLFSLRKQNPFTKSNVLVRHQMSCYFCLAYFLSLANFIECEIACLKKQRVIRPIFLLIKVRYVTMSDVVYKQYISTSYFPKYVSKNFIGKIYPVPSETGIVFFQKSVKD